jgi:pimeloyl-ACP methyl ester carboxylesterase
VGFLTDDAGVEPTPTPTAYFERQGGVRIAYAHTPGRSPTVVLLCGYASDMSGTKARFLEARCKARGQAYLRFDYQGHGESSGDFVDGGVGLWSEDARRLMEGVTEGSLVLVGSSMGAWIMVIVALALKDRVAGLLGIASAPDFSEDLILPALDAVQADTLAREGAVRLTSRYADDPHMVSRHFFEDGRRHLLLRSTIGLRCPVRLLHGLEDADVPWQTTVRLARALESHDVTLTLIKGGEHRLSEQHELEIIDHTLRTLISELA